MLAIIETGGKQYKVKEGTIIDIEKIEVEPSETITFDDVLLVSSDTETLIGQPFVKDAKVSATVLNQIKDKKKIIFKFKRKTGYKKTQGHRQNLTTIKVDKIQIKKTAKAPASEPEKEPAVS
ncbi:50S ribosomal protein L21 [Thermoproteota archaeon]